MSQRRTSRRISPEPPPNFNSGRDIPEQIAENDDSVPRVNTDSEIVIQLPTTGTYYLLVQEWTVWAGEALEDALTGPYQLDVVLVEPADPAVAIDPRNGRDVISAE